jgi:hypothetical protein
MEYVPGVGVCEDELNNHVSILRRIHSIPIGGAVQVGRIRVNGIQCLEHQYPEYNIKRSVDGRESGRWSRCSLRRAGASDHRIHVIQKTAGHEGSPNCGVATGGQHFYGTEGRVTQRDRKAEGDARPRVQRA